ncbi:amino acid permease-domain-containing protein [Xylariaceae sp. FL0662B]|nr:amino acid permease-domain-containing protein [Xylariaceae sp. FL0662B]
MVPPPLDFAGSTSPPRSSRAFIGGAISTAASPRADIELSYRCRTPQRPRGSLPTRPSGSTLAHKDDSSSVTVFSPTDHAWVLSPTTPALLGGKLPDDEGKLGALSAINIIVGKTLGVGAYTIPSAVFAGVGSVGMSLSLWIIGSIVSFCGLAVYLDLGTALPKSGGERVYLERIFRSPYMLATCMFMSWVVLLGFSAPNAIVLGEYALYAFDITSTRWNVRGIAVLVVSVLCYIHARHPRLGLRLVNILGMGKLLILTIVVLSGIAAAWTGLGAQSAAGLALTARRPDPSFTDARLLSTAQRNFSNVWEGSSMQPYNYATALLKIIYCFRGYSTANQVLSEVKDPVRTLKVAAPVALGIVSLAYLAINIAFLLVVDKEDLRSSGVVVAGIFFRNVFGEAVGAHVMPFFVIVTAAGNIAATSFAQARVNEELAKDGLLPCSSFWTTGGNSNNAHHQLGSKGGLPAAPSSSKKTTTPPPRRGLLLHWLVSVAVIVLPPTDRIYNFLVNIGGYPVSVVSVAISAGLFYLHLSPSQRWASPFPARRLAILTFLLFNSLLLILPWIPPADGALSDSGFPYYAYPATALAVLGSGAVYWVWWYRKGGDSQARRLGTRWGGRGNPIDDKKQEKPIECPLLTADQTPPPLPPPLPRPKTPRSEKPQKIPAPPKPREPKTPQTRELQTPQDNSNPISPGQRANRTENERLK